MADKKYLLIIPCSKRKIYTSEGRVPALALYDGPFYRIIRKMFRERGKSDFLDIMILSAKYGLITPEKLINYYECPMTRDMAKRLNGELTDKLSSIVKSGNYEEIFLNLGKLYCEAVRGWENFTETRAKIIYAEGGIGKRARQMRKWLLER